MSGFQFSAPIRDQIAALERNLELLRAFADKHPELEPFAITPLGPTVMLDSSKTAAARSLFGATGWRIEGRTAIKELDGVRIEVRVAAPEPQLEVTL